MDDKKQNIGSIISADLTVENADEIRDFYKEVVGWEFEDMGMSDEDGKYADYVAKDKSGNWVGGVCHKRGSNVDLPSRWIVYVTVENVTASIEACIRLGGKVLKDMKSEDGTCVYALLEDPSGAVIAITPAQEK
jgi:uncharacterized protein